MLIIICFILTDCRKLKSDNSSDSSETAIFLSGDRTVLNDSQEELYWIPNFHNELDKYEYVYMDLDGDNVKKMIIQRINDPCG